MSNTKRGELAELVELLKDFRTNFKNGFLSSDEEEKSRDESTGRSRGGSGVISEAEAVQQIAQLQITSNHLLRMSRQTERTIRSTDTNSTTNTTDTTANNSGRTPPPPQSTTSTTIRYDYSQFSGGSTSGSGSTSGLGSTSGSLSSRYSTKYGTGNHRGPGG